MKKGFTLLEVMIAIIVGSLVMGVLVQSLWQLSKSIKQVSSVSSVDMRVSVFQNLLEKELASAFAPKLIPLKDDESEEKDDEKEKSEKETDEHDEKDEESESTNKEKESPLKKIFYTEHEGDNITLLTFITTSPLDVYNMSKPRVARIMYKLVPDKNNPELFELHRQESSSITDIKKFDSEATEGVKGFVVIDGIKSLKANFLALPVKEKLKKEPASPHIKKEDEKEKKEVQEIDAEKEKEEFIPLERWNVEDQQEQEDKGDDEGKKLPTIPNFIKMTLVLFDFDQQEYAFEFTFAPMYGQKTVLLKGMKRIQPKKKKQEKKDPRTDTIKNIMDKNPLSEGVQGKLDKWQKTASPPPPPGPIMGGVRR